MAPWFHSELFDDAAQLEPLVLKSLRSAMERYTAAGEVKLTVLVTWDDEVRYSRRRRRVTSRSNSTYLPPLQSSAPSTPFR